MIRLTLCALALAGTAHAAPEIIIADFEGSMPVDPVGDFSVNRRG